MAWEPEKKEEPEESKDVAEEEEEEEKQPGPVDMKQEDVMSLETTGTATYPPEDELYNAVTTLLARRIALQVEDDGLPERILDFVRSNLSKTAIKGDIEFSIVGKVTLDEAELLREALV